jgi:hypothetical protein
MTSNAPDAQAAQADEPAKDPIGDLESAHQAYGPEWPAWLSTTSIEPEPEIS